MIHRGYQSLIHALEASKVSSDYAAAFQVHARVVKSGYGTCPSLTASLLSTYVHFNRLDDVSKVVDEVSAHRPDLVNVNKTLSCLNRLGELRIARQVFDKMPARDVVTWNAMISGCLRQARLLEGLSIFRKMLSSAAEPDAFTFASVMAVCARIGSAKQAMWVHDLLVRAKINLNFVLSSALIDMYSKCGRVEAAKQVFDGTERNHVCVWNAMINGLAIHGRALDAMALFSQMEVENVLPDGITFLGILTACSRCGFVQQGRKYFDLMTRQHHSVEPQVEHYGAMVDLLARAGHLGEAYSLINAMPMEPDVVVWRTLLSACKIHKNQALAKVAIERISRLEGGDYVLLSNIYCSLSNWDGAQRLRELMRSMRVRKNPGKSWLEVAGALHHFKASDQSHPETKSIYGVLDGLNRRVKLEGFRPTTELVLMDVDEEEKEENLMGHSEKLALAYGILKSSPGTEIMISKNLRTCHDCHDWMKMVSRVLGRVIVLRDRVRFHRFEGGFCSCGDSW